MLLWLSYCFMNGTAALGQTPTAVTGQIKDVNGLAYSFAKVSASLNGCAPAGCTVIVGGIPVQIQGQQNANTDVNGNFAMNLFCNTAGGGCSVISPSGTTWTFTINENGTPPPVGTGPQTCSTTPSISGASQIVNLASCPALSSITPGLQTDANMSYSDPSGVNPTLTIGGHAGLSSANLILQDGTAAVAACTFACIGFPAPNSSRGIRWRDPTNSFDNLLTLTSGNYWLFTTAGGGTPQPLESAGFISLGTNSVSGCSLTAAAGGPTAGQFASGTTGTCTVTITLPAAPHGWTCDAHDTSTPADVINQTAVATNSATISGSTTSGDVITWKCQGF